MKEVPWSNVCLVFSQDSLVSVVGGYPGHTEGGLWGNLRFPETVSAGLGYPGHTEGASLG